MEGLDGAGALKCLDLFSGIGGFSLACERVGIETVAFVETDPFCRAVLAKHWPGVPIHGDVRELDPEPFRGRVDLITGGFPCQDVSAAGKGAGIGGTRSGLWFHMARIIAGVRPRWILIENVAALRTRGADRVLADLEEIGYDAWPLVVGAWAVGAPHKRDRVWIVAQSQEERHERSMGRRRGRTEPEGGGDDVADADRSGLGEHGGSEPVRPKQLAAQYVCRWPARPGEPQHEWEEPRLVEFSVGSTAPGLPLRLARAANRNALRSLGNAVVPQVAEAVLRAMLEAK